MNTVYSVTINATKNELDSMGVIPAEHWDEAMTIYAHMMSGAASAVFPGASVDVMERASTQGIEYGVDDGDTYAADMEFGTVADQTFEAWCEWVCNQPWFG